jgi:hypothetical protein
MSKLPNLTVLRYDWYLTCRKSWKNRKNALLEKNPWSIWIFVWSFCITVPSYVEILKDMETRSLQLIIQFKKFFEWKNLGLFKQE